METQIGYQKKTIGKQIPVFWKFVLAIILCEGTGLLSGLFSSPGMSGWFDMLRKPVWNPPSFIFAPVWTVLYLMMGIALALVWQAHTEIIKEKTALYLFGIQLFFNFWWSIIFFRFHSPGLAFIEIILLIVCILATISAFIRINKTAAWLLAPYFAWVCFAAILNATIWLMNA